MAGDFGDDPLLHRYPVAAIVEEGAGLLDDLADMRFAGYIVLR